MHALRRHVPVLIAVGSIAFVSATYAAGTETANVTQRSITPSLRFRNVSVERGLPNVQVTAMRQDREGYMWIATYDGLARYDGYDFTVIREHLPDFAVIRLEVDPTTGDLWVGTAKGLARVDPKTNKVTAYSLVPKGAKPDAAGEPPVLALAVADDGTVWAGTNGFGLARVDPKSGDVQVVRHEEGRAKGLSFDTVTALLAVKGKLWIGTGGAGVDVMATSSRTFTEHYEFRKGSDEYADADLITALHSDGAGTLWIGTGSGLVRLDEKTGQSKIIPLNSAAASPSNDVNDIVDGEAGTLWIATNRNLFAFDPKRGPIGEYTHDRGDPASLPSERVLSLFRDREHIVWAGTLSDGFGCFHPLSTSFTFYNFDVRSVHEDAAGHLWIGTPSELCRTEQPHTWTGTLSCYDIGALVRDIYTDPTGIVWGATNTSGMFRLDPKTRALTFYEPAAEGAKEDSGPNAGFITKLHGTRDGIWLATFGGGLNYFDKTNETFRVFVHNPSDKASLSSDDVYTLAPARQAGVFWLATADGVNRFDTKTGRVTAVFGRSEKTDTARTDTIDEVTSVYEANDGTLWAGTYGGGLLKIDPARNQVQRFTDAEEHGRNSILNVLGDEQGTLWMSTEGGITRFDPKKPTFERFYQADGLQGLAFTNGAAYKDTTGVLSFGGIHGVNVIRPSSIHRQPYQAPLVLRRLQIDGHDAPVDQTRLSLPFNHKVLTLDFSALSYIDPDASHYMYKIEGLSDWIDLGTRHFVTINTLPAGNYTIQVKGKSRTGTWNESGVQLAIHVNPPPWRTWWAYTIYGILVLLFIGAFIFRQRAQIEALRRTHRLSELEREVALTSALQEGFLPAERSVREGAFSLEGFYRAAAECGGDWWSYEVRGDRYLIVVGDATGHGVGSAMVTAATAACFRSLRGIMDDESRLIAMNDEVLRVSRGQYHMTLTVVDLDAATGEYVVMSAGGVPVFSMAPGGYPRVLMCPGTPLGSAQFEVGHLRGRVAPGERLLLLTDGLPEVALANQQLLGPRGIANLYAQTREVELGEALRQLVTRVEELQATAQDDDWTAVMVQWGSS